MVFDCFSLHQLAHGTRVGSHSDNLPYTSIPNRTLRPCFYEALLQLPYRTLQSKA